MFIFIIQISFPIFALTYNLINFRWEKSLERYMTMWLLAFLQGLSSALYTSVIPFSFPFIEINQFQRQMNKTLHVQKGQSPTHTLKISSLSQISAMPDPLEIALKFLLHLGNLLGKITLISNISHKLKCSLLLLVAFYY